MNQILNFESFLTRLGDDIEIGNELLLLFIDTVPEQLDTLKSAIEEKNNELIQYTAHTLKGSSGNISADKLAKTAAMLEIAGKEGNIKGSESLFSVLIIEYKEVEDVIRKALDTYSAFQ